MGRQYNKVVKRRRRVAYQKRKLDAVKAKAKAKAKPAPAAAEG